MRRTVRALAALFLLLAVRDLQAAETRVVDRGYSRQTAYATADPALDRLQDLFRPTLEANRKEFAGRSGPVKAFGAGARYPQVWLRDSATVVPLARYHYPAAYLTSWIEEHLANQAPDGGLDDWIASGPPSAFVVDAPRAREVFRLGAAAFTADKNTVEADQESSAVLAACQAFGITGDRAWLRKATGGVTVLDRADRALGFVLAKRFDGRLGLVTSGFSADWGDVSPAYPDQRAIYLDERTPLVAGLYTNALFAEAARCLGELHQAADDTRGAERWRGVAAGVRSAANRHLWQEGGGFYRMHVPLVATGLPDDSGVFATGGNAVALLSGIADERQARRVLAAAGERQRRFAVSTIAGTLLPPYRAGLFAHPAMREPWTYQNGGQWDWFGARLVLAAFERGQSAVARRWLVELARKAERNGGLHEWQTRDGEGRGSPTYAGSAGALAAAVFEGLFGVSLSADELSLTVRLGPEPGRIHLYQPATDTFVAYRYEPAARSLVLEYDSNHRRPGRIALLIPRRRAARAVLMDGRPAPFRIEARGAERYASLATSWGRHRLEVRLRSEPQRQGDGSAAPGRRDADADARIREVLPSLPRRHKSPDKCADAREEDGAHRARFRVREQRLGSEPARVAGGWLAAIGIRRDPPNGPADGAGRQAYECPPAAPARPPAYVQPSHIREKHAARLALAGSQGQSLGIARDERADQRFLAGPLQDDTNAGPGPHLFGGESVGHQRGQKREDCEHPGSSHGILLRNARSR